jgi:uncharacterized Tic20 family protein
MEETPPLTTPPLTSLPLSTSQRVVAAMAHLFAIIPFWGLVADFWIWHTRREEHPELRFQAAQAMFLQAFGFLMTAFYATAQVFFKLLGVLNADLSNLLCRANTLIWEACLIALVLIALAAAWQLRWRGRFDYPFFGAVLRRELDRSEAEM